MQIETYHPDHLLQLRELINSHIGAMAPGWSLTEAAIASHLQRNPHEPLIDPWVIKRRTLIVMHKEGLIAAAHLLRYGSGQEVSGDYHDTGEIAWLVFNPHYQEQAAALLAACHEQMRAWSVAHVMASNLLPIPICMGIPEIWQHVTMLLAQAGYERGDHKEAMYGGWLRDVPLPGACPVEGMTVQRRFKDSGGMSFVACLGDDELGECQVDADLTNGHERPSLIGWGELSYMHVKEEWRNRALGSWLVQHAMEWLRMAGCTRIVLAVDSEDEERGAGRFYNRFGWQPFVRMRGWHLRQW